ncbi:MAG: flagellar hook capping FlgD N-terminal domain-containing protein [Bauldia sp.]
MDFSAIAASNRTSDKTAADKDTLISSYDAFLQLLTTQLKNQSPLDPLDANQFTQQLVQFSTVEQAIKSNDNLLSLIDVTRAANATSLLSFVGTQVSASGNGTYLKDGQAAWQYDASASGSGLVTIRNAAGAIVFTDRPALTAGSHTYSWNGRMTNGQFAPDGPYTIEISGTGKDGAALNIDTLVAGTVTGIDFSGAEPILRIGSFSVPVSDVRTIGVTH